MEVCFFELDPFLKAQILMDTKVNAQNRSPNLRLVDQSLVMA